MTTFGTFRVPTVTNEPNKHFAKGSSERRLLLEEITRLKGQLPLEIPLYVNGKPIFVDASNNTIETQSNPAHHSSVIARYPSASDADTTSAITSALAAKPQWEALPFAERAAIFLKAADLISGKYRCEIMATTMLGQGKNVWQAEIDAAAELCDFLRFNVTYAQEIYGQQPVHHAPGVWNRLEYRPLEGFVYAITPFNFTAIAGNLPCAPALLGNVVVWKPSPHAILSNWILYRILLEAGLPPNVIQFLPGDAERITATVLAHHDFAALHYTGSSEVFRSLYGRIGDGIRQATYKSYPRVVGETGGKNFHLVHGSADVRNAVMQTVRAAFEFQGQKCSACSRCYVASSIWPAFKNGMVKATKALSIGDPTETDESKYSKGSKGLCSFVGPVIHRGSFDKLSGVIDAAKSDPELELLVGGSYDCSEGYYIRPTVYLTTNPRHELMSRELFGPILVVYVYDDDDDEDDDDDDDDGDDGEGGKKMGKKKNNKTTDSNHKSSTHATVTAAIPKTAHPSPQHLRSLNALASLISSTSPYALTGALFATSRPVIHHLATSNSTIASESESESQAQTQTQARSAKAPPGKAAPSPTTKTTTTTTLAACTGNFYINCKCTGAVVGQQPFGGGRASGTNQKAGSQTLLANFVEARCVKEEFGGGFVGGSAGGLYVGGEEKEAEEEEENYWGVEYPSNEV